MVRKEGSGQYQDVTQGKGQVRLRAAFSLLEMLVVISVIALLLAILMPAMQACRRAGRNLKCAGQMRQVSFEFRIFADDFAVRTRGESDQAGPGRFEMKDFLDMMYKVDEFWDVYTPLPRVQYDPNEEPMMCPEGPRYLVKRVNNPPPWQYYYPITPARNVSVAVNRRLYRPPPLGTVVAVTSRILDYPDVPLAMDIDGVAADAAGVDPLYIGPPVSTEADNRYTDGRYWHPALRHGGKLNVAFVGGHVVSSADPLGEPSWRWGYIAGK